MKLDLVDSTVPSGALQPDGRFAIATLGQISGGQLPDYQTSAFFLFNDNTTNDTNEVGEVFVAHLQFHDEPLSASQIQSLGLAAAVAAALLAARRGKNGGCRVVYRAASLRLARARCTSGSIS